MSVLTTKHILVVGDENSQIHNLENELEAQGMIIHTSTCDSVTKEMIVEKEIDVILLNHLHDGEICRNMLSELSTAEFEQAMPIFALVANEESAIQDALSLGAADYVTADESTDSIVQKISAIFGANGAFGDHSVIDLTEAPAEVSATGIRVFVIEDDPLLRNLLSIRLQKSDFPHEFNSDGVKAIQAMQQFKPQVIILDLMLPGISGFEIMEQVKADNQLKEIPVIIFSNRDSQDDRHRANELGAAGFYVKAMTDLSEMVETIERLAAK